MDAICEIPAFVKSIKDVIYIRFEFFEGIGKTSSIYLMMNLKREREREEEREQVKRGNTVTSSERNSKLKHEKTGGIVVTEKG